MPFLAALRALLLGIALAASPGATLFAQTPAAATQAVPDKDYVLGPGDVIEAAILGRDDFKVRARIDSAGAIQVPFLGSITAAGKSPAVLASEMAKSLESGGYFAHPVLSVDIVSYASRYVTVLGAVGAPGLVPIDRAYRVSDILARVGGIKENGADYVVLRRETGGEQRLLVSAIATGDDSQDPYVAPGDRIFSPPSQVFYITGQVHTPGAYSLSDGMSVRMAIARGGGLTDLGTDKGVKVTHADGHLEKPGLDGKVRPGDVVTVGERLF
jgi:polysaccharide export outer membrane protein